MTKTNNKKALLSSAFALVLSVAMLIGTTFAWFTDTASTGVNKIVSGNLKVDIIGETSDSHISTLKFTKAGAETDAGAAEEILWEPGCRYLTEGFRIANKGNLALKWKAQVNMNNIINGKVEGSTIAKDGKSLLDVIDFYVVTSTDENAEAVAIENFVGNLKKTETSEVYYIKGVMQTTAGNDYQDLTLDGITVTVIAAQDTVENDSFDNQYDKDAKYPIVAMDTLQELINNAAEPVSAKLEGNIAGSLTVPQDKNITLDLNGFTLTGGDTHAILNRGTLCIKDSSGNGKIVASKANTSALRNVADCVIEGGTFTRAEAEGNKWHTVENFGNMTFNGGKVIAEDGQSFAIVNGWNYINPGEQKATMTINNIEMKAGPNGLKNCTGGILTMNGGTLHCTGYWGLSNDSTGVATINGGKIISDSYVAISNGGAKMEINGGTFTGPQGSLYVQNYAQDTVVKGGSYQKETVEFMQKYCPNGYTATLEGDMVVVSKN
jgi:predicted ribosomally synthesized peptide with SipW-like signal peptide